MLQYIVFAQKADSCWIVARDTTYSKFPAIYETEQRAKEVKQKLIEANVIQDVMIELHNNGTFVKVID